MTQYEAWRIFEQTGNIEAYLLYLEMKPKEKERRDISEEMPGEPYFTD